MKIVLDTNVVLYFLVGRLIEVLPPAEFFISVITEMELLSYPLLASAEETIIHDFCSDVTIVDLNREIKSLAIALRRQHRLKLPDALIAATAQYLRATLYTNDLKISSIPLLSTKVVMLKN
ncbi:type II toxin-antitoxin system VapC family toxin [Chromatium okenii]|uniref:type II toxin-antitoxin system VapC family toxin n=1 Tax=Chromatium okenii TaxID=61644 RepID=UPI0026F13B8E|nr:type II toxin-antitoxin system VapC family toxin [Chromatium okenii]MBV5308177.1 type II toxin-antitoxin system VapC family toxin [Chromatium okenii]